MISPFGNHWSDSVKERESNKEGKRKEEEGGRGLIFTRSNCSLFVMSRQTRSTMEAVTSAPLCSFFGSLGMLGKPLTLYQKTQACAMPMPLPMHS